MRKERLLYILLGALFITYVAVEYYSPKPLDWTVTFSEKDKNPYGAYILYDRLGDFFPEKAVSFQTLYESRDSADHLLILGEQFQPSEADIAALFRMLEQGRSIMINAQAFSRELLDTLDIAMDYDPAGPLTNDSVRIAYGGREVNVPAAFATSRFDTDSLGEEWEVHAKAGGPVLIRKHFQKGNLILSTLPLAFTNYGLLYGDIAGFVASSLRLMPYEGIHYNRFYQSGKPGPATPLRYLLSQPALRWAVYLALLVLLLYLATSSRRIQRMIPLLERHKNTTTHFIKTMGGLHYREANHKNAAQKLAGHFLKTLSARYFIHTYNEKAYHLLAAKTGLSVAEVIATFNLIQGVKKANHLSEEGLKQLYEKLHKFNIF